MVEGYRSSTDIAMADGGRIARRTKKDSSDDLKLTGGRTDNDGDPFPSGKESTALPVERFSQQDLITTLLVLMDQLAKTDSERRESEAR